MSTNLSAKPASNNLTNNDTDNKKRIAASCINCAIKSLCLAKALDGTTVTQLSNIVRHPKPARKKDHIYRQADSFKSVFVVHSGAIKTYRIGKDGSEQIAGFYLPGEIFGIDGLSNNKHVNSAVALDTTSICEIPFSTLELLFAEHINLQRNFMSALSAMIIEEQQVMLLLSQKSADERLAHFLLNLSQRYQQRRQSANDFQLPMNRKDIGNFIGVAVETLSRLMARFQNRGWIHASNRSITILNREAIEELVDPPSIIGGIGN